MKKLIAFAALMVIAALAVPAYGATRTVRVDDNFFSPESISIRKNDTINFRWVGDAPHNVTKTRGPSFTRIANRRSGTVARKFRRVGTYRLVCTIHGGMDMRVRVR